MIFLMVETRCFSSSVPGEAGGLPPVVEEDDDDDEEEKVQRQDREPVRTKPDEPYPEG